MIGKTSLYADPTGKPNDYVLNWEGKSYAYAEVPEEVVPDYLALGWELHPSQIIQKQEDIEWS